MIRQITGIWGCTPAGPQNSVALSNTKEQASWMGNSGTPPPPPPAYHRIPSTPWETPNSLESLRAHGVCWEHGALAWGGQNSGRSVFLSRDLFGGCWALSLLISGFTLR